MRTQPPPCFRLLRTLALACGLALTSAAQAQSPPADADLRAEIDMLKRALPDQAHVMSDVDYHFANLWFAGEAGNWGLAGHFLNETRSHLDWAVRLRPKRQRADGSSFDLKPYVQTVEEGGLYDANQALEQHDKGKFERAYRDAMAQCYACHVAAEKPFLRLHIPQTPASRMLDFTAPR